MIKLEPLDKASVPNQIWDLVAGVVDAEEEDYLDEPDNSGSLLAPEPKLTRTQREAMIGLIAGHLYPNWLTIPEEFVRYTVDSCSTIYLFLRDAVVAQVE